ncbi:MAG: FliG C-terminal domain-containing protein [Pseudomonadota bacterium]
MNMPAVTGGAPLGQARDAHESWETLGEGGPTADELSPIQKAAIILAAIGPETSAEFLKGMNEAALTRTAVAISRLDRISTETLDAVIAEFVLSIGTEEEVSGGSQTARRLLSEVLDDATIDRIMFDVEGGDTRKAWKKLNDISNAALVSFVGGEHPQTAAVILSELRADKAASVLERLDPEFAQQTVLRLSRTPALSPDVAEMVERVIARDFLSALQRTNRARRPADLIAGMMNNVSAQNREKFLTFLEGERPNLHRDVLKTMFTFNDIRHRVEARDVPIIIKEVEEPVLTTALKWGQMQNNASAPFILENLSKRLAERLEEDVAGMPEPTQRDGEAAHQELVRTIQDMAKQGTIQLIEEETPED